LARQHEATRALLSTVPATHVPSSTSAAAVSEFLGCDLMAEL